MVVLGRGQPLLVIPGLQGRWQWMLPGIRALAAHRRVITYSLAGDGEDLLPLVATRFDDLVRQARNALARAGVSRATVCGVSYGALIATRLAARHPELVSSLVLASPLPPDFVPDARVRRLIRHPRLLAPGFLAAAPARTLPEIRCARPDDWPACAATMLALVARWPQSPVRMAERIRWLADESLVGDARQVRCRTLIITGVDGLDLVVPPRSSLRYRRLIPHAEAMTLPDTGHFGIVTRPEAFARLIAGRDGPPGRPASTGHDPAFTGGPAADQGRRRGQGRPGEPSLPWGDLT